MFTAFSPSNLSSKFELLPLFGLRMPTPPVKEEGDDPPSLNITGLLALVPKVKGESS